MKAIRQQAADILRANDRGGFTIPAAGLYPYQWLWDSCFCALGWATFDEKRAWEELSWLFKGQWPDGMLAHIIFHHPDPSYFPGPEVWATHHDPPTSGITQPPVVATIVRQLLERACDRTLAQDHARQLYPKLLAFHRWLHGARDPEHSGLVAVLHPWETGMDNSPAWDTALEQVPIVQLPPYQRKDTSHVAETQRPRPKDYDRYLSLVVGYRERGYEPEALYRETSFKVADVGFCALLQRADEDLLALAQMFGEPSAEIEGWLDRGRKGFRKLWDDHSGIYRSLNLSTGEPIPVITSASFLPLFAGLPSAEEAQRLVEYLGHWGDEVRYLVPSTDPADPHFEPERYWRGPVWVQVNWLIAQGLKRYGYAALAGRLREDIFELVEGSGFHEYYHPVTGEGLGGRAFSWTAALLLAWPGEG